MSRRGVVGGIVAAIASVAPLSGVAHAQDLDCRNFVYQEDAQAVFDANPADPNRLDEDRGVDDGIACEVLPHRPTASPSRASVPVPLTPTRGVQGGTGGAVHTGPSVWDVSLGAGLTAAGVLAAVVVLRRMRRG
ncbi:excalibur calcium-binding protein [Streptomyces sp. NPDC004082]|uniref:excalibur calcium-binding protein n=1 Tax=unclassified Streptomyces TaxID=2593676 RepID=UPI00339F74B1